MGKLTKLLREPRAFLRDAQVVERSALLQRLFAFRVRRCIVHDAISIEAWASRCLGDVPAVVIRPPATRTTRYGVEQSRWFDLVTNILELSRQEPAMQLSFAPRRRGLSRLRSRRAQLGRATWLQCLIANGDGSFLRFGFELWNPIDGFLVGTRRNAIARRLSEDAAAELGAFRVPRVELADSSAHPATTEATLPVDVVYTWVNHRDPQWQALYQTATGREPSQAEAGAASIDRFLSRDELRYSLRSVAEFAPWVNHVYVVSNCSPPDWLNTECPGLSWIDHRQILPAEGLPTFSSHAIESRLHHIPGLGQHFLYFNDDFFLMRRVCCADFYHPSGIAKAFLEEYAAVVGSVHPEDPDYLNAARNGRALLEQRFGRAALALHKHTPYALRRDVLLDIERDFPEPLARTSAQRFRTPNDISLVSFLHHHYALMTGRAVTASINSALVKPASKRYVGRLHALANGRLKVTTLCLNDGAGSLGDARWDRLVPAFLAAFFPHPSCYEKAAAPLPQAAPVAAQGIPATAGSLATDQGR